MGPEAGHVDGTPPFCHCTRSRDLKETFGNGRLTLTNLIVEGVMWQVKVFYDDFFCQLNLFSKTLILISIVYTGEQENVRFTNPVQILAEFFGLVLLRVGTQLLVATFSSGHQIINIYVRVRTFKKIISI